MTARSDIGVGASPPPRSAASAEWDRYASDWLVRQPQRLWREHSDTVNAELLRRWLPRERVSRILKTDLFDEAVTTGLFPLLAAHGDTVVGIDVSHEVLRAAATRHAELRAIGADVRRLPAASNHFDIVVSLSTLDHFGTTADISVALAELYRVLRPGGILILTLDNQSNPVIALRNRLPFGLMHAAGIVPYPVGRSVGYSAARRFVAATGFEVREHTAIMHAPRALAVPIMSAIGGIGGPRACAIMSRAAMTFEKLMSLPTRFLTGHFIAILAAKPIRPAPTG